MKKAIKRHTKLDTRREAEVTYMIAVATKIVLDFNNRDGEFDSVSPLAKFWLRACNNQRMIALSE